MKKIGILSDIMKTTLVNSVNSSGVEREFFSVKREYIESILKSKDFLPIIIPNIELYNKEFIDLVDGLVLVGGQDIPAKLYGESDLPTSVINEKRFNNEINFVKDFLKTNKPILGICAGMQIINVCLGGKMDQFIDGHQIKENTKLEDNVHEIKIQKNTKLFEILKKESTYINTAHKQAIRSANLPKEITVSSLTRDGVIESIELKNHKFCLGLQWHPEHCPNDDSFKIFDAFLDSIC